MESPDRIKTLAEITLKVYEHCTLTTEGDEIAALISRYWVPMAPVVDSADSAHRVRREIEAVDQVVFELILDGTKGLVQEEVEQMLREEMEDDAA